MTDPSELEALALAAESFGRLAEAINTVTEKMADKSAQLQAEQAEIRDGMLALSNRIEALTRTAVVHMPERDKCVTCGWPNPTDPCKKCGAMQP